ncbi:MAG: serine hydrolase [Candidatus Gastranaerophilaceae bacterium]
MPELARQYDRSKYRYNYYNAPEQKSYYHQNFTREQPNVRAVPTQQRYVRRTVDTKKVERNNFIHRIISVSLVTLMGICILPTGFNKVTKNIFNPTPYKNIKVDFRELRFPTANYLSNHWFLGENSLRGAEVKKPQMTSLNENQRLTGLENQLQNLASMYPSIHPSVFVWDYESGNYADMNADEIFATASIIKLPVLAELFRSIEQGELTIYDEMPLTEYYRTEGSGSLQFKAANSTYTIDTLARMMITESDNSATNMLIAKLGSMTDINRAIRNWGLKHTGVQTWLPDYDGTNHTTARDMATILYNLDNPNFLSVTSRERIFDYMGHVHNNRLIQAGLPAGTVFMHKTGDIGKMLGDAGIVFAPDGKKYIVVILANRPHNSPLGKEFIVKASEIIYNNMVR